MHRFSMDNFIVRPAWGWFSEGNIEVRFTSKPAPEQVQALNDLGFRYGKRTRHDERWLWYTRVVPERWAQVFKFTELRLSQ